jgi:hypothetical protein
MSGRWPVAKEAETKPTQKTCFVVTQIGEKGSPERIHADWVFEEILSPLFERKYKDFKLVRADKISKPGLIDAQIIGLLASSELVIADLTNLNPNVFYEIGIRHAARKPIIHMHVENQKIPFDVTLFRSLPFSLREPSELRAARSSLEELIDAVLAPDFEIDNPVTRAIDKIGLEGTATPAERVLSRQVESLALRILELEKIGVGRNGLIEGQMNSSSSRKIIGIELRNDDLSEITGDVYGLILDNLSSMFGGWVSSVMKKSHTISIYFIKNPEHWQIREFVVFAESLGLSVSFSDS